jgi:hypothetical protein
MNPKDLILDKYYLCFSSKQKTSKARYYFMTIRQKNCSIYYFTKVDPGPFPNFAISGESIRSSIKEVTPLWNILYEN